MKAQVLISLNTVTVTLKAENRFEKKLFGSLNDADLDNAKIAYFDENPHFYSGSSSDKATVSIHIPSKEL